MNIRTACTLTALLFLLAPLAVLTPAAAQTIPPLPTPPSWSPLDEALANGAMEGEATVANGFRLADEVGEHDGQELADGEGIDDSQAVNLGKAGGHAALETSSALGQVILFPEGTVPLGGVESLSFQYRVPATLSTAALLGFYMPLDFLGTSDADACLVGTSQSIASTGTSWIPVVLDGDSPWVLADGGCGPVASPPTTLDDHRANPLLASARVISLHIQSLTLAPEWEDGEPIYIDDASIMVAASAASCTEPAGPSDPLWVALCQQALALNGVPMFSARLLGEKDADADGRADVAQVNVTLPALPAKQPASPASCTGPTPSASTTSTSGSPPSVSISTPSPAPSVPGCTDGETTVVPKQTIYVQLDYFYTPTGATPPYDVSSPGSGFDYSVPGVMLYNGEGQFTTIQSDSHRFTDHYQGEDGRYAIYQTSNGAALVATNPAKSDLFVSNGGTTSLRIDVDLTPYLGTGCAEGAKFAGQDRPNGVCDNSIDEGEGGGKKTPTWIRIQAPGQAVPGTDQFPDDRGILLEDIHVKWPTDKPATQMPSFQTFATQFSNLDNDPNTDFEELNGGCGTITNPTNPRSHCGDWDGDEMANPDDPDDFAQALAVEISLRATLPDGSALSQPLAVPAEVDLRYTCKINRGSVTSATLELGWQYNGGITPAGTSTLNVPVSHCNGVEHSVSESTDGDYPAYVYLVTGTATTQVVSPAFSIVRPVGATTTTDTTPATAARFTLTGFDAVTLSPTTSGSNSPVRLAGSTVACRELTSYTATVPGALSLSLNAATHGDDANGSPTSFACSAAGTTTAFQPVYYNNANGTGTPPAGTARSIPLTFTASFSGANPVTKTSPVAVAANAHEKGTLAATGCTPAPCTKASASIAWEFTPSTLADEGGQAWSRVVLQKKVGANFLNVGDMDFSGGKYRLPESSRSGESTYRVLVLDEGKRWSNTLVVSAMVNPNGELVLGEPNAVPTVGKAAAPFDKPVESQYTLNTADPAKSTVTTQFFANARDLGPAGRAATATTGETPLNSFIVKVQFLTATDLDGQPAPVPAAVRLTPTNCAAQCPEQFNGNTNDGEQFSGPVSLSPLLSYTYRYNATDAQGATAVSATFTLNHAINDDNPQGTPPGDIQARPLSFAFLAVGGGVTEAQRIAQENATEALRIVTENATEAERSVTENATKLQGLAIQALADLCAQPGAQLPGGENGLDPQACVEHYLFVVVCDLPADSKPTDLTGCQGDVQGAVQAALDFAYEQACPSADTPVEECAEGHVDSAVENATSVVETIQSIIEGGIAAVCDAIGDPLEFIPGLCPENEPVPVPDPERALTGEGGCNLAQPDQWVGNPELWDDSCNQGSVSDVGQTLSDLVVSLLEDGMPTVPLPGDEQSYNLPDAGGDNRGTGGEPNGQVDYVESRILGYRSDDGSNDAQDRFDGSGRSGITLFVGDSGGYTPATAPKRAMTVRIGDVAGTPAQEILVVEQETPQAGTTKVTCLVVAPSPGTLDSAFVHQGTKRFREDGDGAAVACGPAVRSTAIHVDLLNGLADGTIGLMAWEDRDGDGQRVASGGDADASRPGGATDLLGFRLQVRPGSSPALRLDVNQGGAVTTQQTRDDGFVAAFSMSSPVSSMGPVPVLMHQGAEDFVVTVDPYELAGGVYSAYPAGRMLKLHIQLNCGELQPALADIARCEDDHPILYNSQPQAGRTFTVPASALASAFEPANETLAEAFPDGYPFSALNVFVSDDTPQSGATPGDDARYSSFSLQANALIQALAHQVADILDDAGAPFTPVVVTNPAFDLPACAPQATATDPQGDKDGDGIVNACDAVDDRDVDGDTVPNGSDNCPTVPNAPVGGSQADLDDDGIGDACDVDQDGDEVDDKNADFSPKPSSSGGDNCPTTANDQANFDDDADGDVCDLNDDNDSKDDPDDPCQFSSPPGARTAGTGPDNDHNDDGCQNDEAADLDDDGDTKADASDPCRFSDPPGAMTPGQGANNDFDQDGCQNDEDADDDKDLKLDVNEACDFSSPLGITQANTTDNGDWDQDGCQNDEATDDDGDTKADASDLCRFSDPPGISTSGTAENQDLDQDGCQNDEDPDDDKDAVPDVSDGCPRGTLGAGTGNPGSHGANDPDADGCRNDEDADDDGDKIADLAADPDGDGDGSIEGGPDNCPLAANGNQDNFDGDAQGDVCDTDDDNDGALDTAEDGTSGTSSMNNDTDADGFSDGSADPDGAGPVQANDNCPAVANADQVNTDGAADGGDACDSDDDNDTVNDDVPDKCPKDGAPAEPLNAVMPTLKGCPNTSGLGDGFVAAIKLPDDPSPAIALDGEEKTFTVTVFKAGVAAASGSYTLYVQVDCGAVPRAAVGLSPLQCSGDGLPTEPAVDDVKTLQQSFTATGQAVGITFTAAQMASLLQAPLPATAVHVWVANAAGDQSNYALPTSLLLGDAPSNEVLGLVDLLDADLWHPVPVLAAAPTDCPAPLTGDGVPDCSPPQVACPAPLTGDEVPDCSPAECPDGQVGAGAACATPPEQLACLADDSCVDDVTEALCALAGTPGGSVDDCLVALPDAVAAMVCDELDLCAEDGDGDGIPDDADQCDGEDDKDLEECPAPDPDDVLFGNVPVCSEGETLSIPGVGTICIRRQGGVFPGVPGLLFRHVDGWSIGV